MDLENLKNQAEKELRSAKTLKELDAVFRDYLGKKNGKLTQILRSLKDLPQEEKGKTGKEANKIKEFLKIQFSEKIKEITEKDKKEIKKDWTDVTAPGVKVEQGHLHPLTQIMRRIEDIFQGMGFSVVEGNEVESEWYNFDALNFPLNHPAREMQDTFFVKQENREELANKKKLVLRTQTSPVQIHFMEKNNPPLRIIVPGRVFRSEATDASHEVQFYQVEGLMVDRKISVANFKAVIEEFLKQFFEEKKGIKIRLRPSFFPFTEPSFEIDIGCIVCNGKGCSVCGQTGWVEVMGAGMVHPNVFKAAGLNPSSRVGGWQGFAFGLCPDRLAMMKYKINDIRLFYSGDLRFLKQF